MTELEILKLQIAALKELVAIKDSIIMSLRANVILSDTAPIKLAAGVEIPATKIIVG